MLLYVGRFTAIKRLSLLITAYARARAAFTVPAPLVLLGGFPGEWEGEHPLETIQRTGVGDVFLAGWHEHGELADIFAASDIVVLPSVREHFGQVLVEGMACGLPAIAVAAQGPSEIVTDDGQSLTAPYSAPSAGPPPWDIYQITPDAVFALGTAEPYGAAHWRF